MKLTFPSSGMVQAGAIAFVCPAVTQAAIPAETPAVYSDDTSVGAGTLSAGFDRPEVDAFDTYRVAVTTENHQWSPLHMKRFQRLAAKEAMGEISSEELQEIEELQSMRRRDVLSKNPEEILQSIRRRKMAKDLLEFFEKHSFTIEGADRSRKRA